MTKRRRVLMVAFHFPPQRGSSGIQRTLRFARYLPEFGWEPQILTVHPRAYEAVDNTDDIPPGLVVNRAHAFDAARHFAIGNRYPSYLARPDRWASWWWSAVPAGLAAIHRFRPDVLWSTYPIATAHAIGHSIARLSRLPWIADFRDPMAQDGYPADPATWRVFKRIEVHTIRRARRSIFATHGAAEEYRRRYPEYAERFFVIENGYDEEMFTGLDPRARTNGTPIVLLHSGIVYPLDRDPTALFQALHVLHERNEISPGNIEVRFRAPIHDQLIDRLAARFGVQFFVKHAPHLPYREALAEMQEADGLLIMQAAICNQQIPAKFYEYVRAGRPIIGLTDPVGDTARAMRAAGIVHIAALENAEAIAEALPRFLAELKTGSAAIPRADYVRRSSRRERTADLALSLDAAIGS